MNLKNTHNSPQDKVSTKQDNKIVRAFLFCFLFLFVCLCNYEPSIQMKWEIMLPHAVSMLQAFK